MIIIKVVTYFNIFIFLFFKKAYYESNPPIDNNEKRSIYHIREFEVFKLLQVNLNFFYYIILFIRFQNLLIYFFHTIGQKE